MTEEKSKKKFPNMAEGHTPFLNFFALWVITLAFVYVGAITFAEVPDGNVGFANTSLGFILGSVVTPIVIWGFRSSKAQIDKEKVEQEIKLNGGGVG